MDTIRKYPVAIAIVLALGLPMAAFADGRGGGGRGQHADQWSSIDRSAPATANPLLWTYQSATNEETNEPAKAPVIEQSPALAQTTFTDNNGSLSLVHLSF